VKSMVGRDEKRVGGNKVRLLPYFKRPGQGASSFNGSSKRGRPAKCLELTRF
jgi:hypothetical protein